MAKSRDRDLHRTLAEAIARTSSASTKFATDGTLPGIDPDVSIEGVGPIRFPLSTAVAKKLRSTGQVAPYGKGTRTLVDPTVRKTLEIDAASVRLGAAWNAAIAHAVRGVAARLGLP